MSNRRLSDRAWFDEHVKIIKVDVPPAPMFAVVAEGTASVDENGDVTLDLVPRCDCTNRLTADDIERGDGMCEWCYAARDECQILVEIDGRASGERIGTCEADGRPIFRSRMAGTIYHATEDR